MQTYRPSNELGQCNFGESPQNYSRPFRDAGSSPNQPCRKREACGIMACMPSWNIHTAHVERLLADCRAQELGIADVNAFLFGNYVPDIYVGFMVPDVSVRIDYCMTHWAAVNTIPIPDADRFWDTYIYKRRPSSPTGVSLAVGAWAHLVADRFCNGRFRRCGKTHETREGEELRKQKQADFDLFGHALGISSAVEVTPELLAAAMRFRGYSILEEDVTRSVRVADDIVRASAEVPSNGDYQLLSAEWMADTFEACNERLELWLGSWRALEASGTSASSSAIRADLGLPPATPDEEHQL